jgi:hypothetical protein
MMNLQGFVRGDIIVIKLLSVIYVDGLRKATETSVRIVGVRNGDPGPLYLDEHVQWHPLISAGNTQVWCMAVRHA